MSDVPKEGIVNDVVYDLVFLVELALRSSKNVGFRLGLSHFL